MSDERQHTHEPDPSPRPQRDADRRQPERFPPVRRDDSVEQPDPADDNGPGTGSDA